MDKDETTDVVPSGEVLCFSCLSPNNERDHFCAECEAPLSSYASTAPFERIFSEGALLRRASSKPNNRLVLLGIWALFFPTLLMCLFIGFSVELPMLQRMFYLIFGGSISSVLLIKTTLNYCKKRKVGS